MASGSPVVLRFSSCHPFFFGAFSSLVGLSGSFGFVFERFRRSATLNERGYTTRRSLPWETGCPGVCDRARANFGDPSPLLVESYFLGSPLGGTYALSRDRLLHSTLTRFFHRSENDGLAQAKGTEEVRKRSHVTKVQPRARDATAYAAHKRGLLPSVFTR